MALKVKLFSPFTLILTVFLILYLGTIGIKSFFRYNVFKKEQQALFVELAEKKKQNEILKCEYKNLKEKAYLEFIIRKSLAYIKPGERVYKFYYDEERK